jgi:hypothetical protein
MITTSPSPMAAARTRLRALVVVLTMTSFSDLDNGRVLFEATVRVRADVRDAAWVVSSLCSGR